MNNILEAGETVNKMLRALEEEGWANFESTMRKIGVIFVRDNELNIELWPILMANPDPFALADVFGSLFTEYVGWYREDLCRQLITWRSKLSRQFSLITFSRRAGKRHNNGDGILYLLRSAEKYFAEETEEKVRVMRASAKDSAKEKKLVEQRRADITAGIEVVQFIQRQKALAIFQFRDVL